VNVDGNLEGRRALVTGGNRGIGLVVCRMLAELGAQVYLGSRDVDVGERAASSLRPVSVEVVRIDVADPASVRETADRLGPAGVDVLVNNAAINPRASPDADEIERAWQTNLLGAWRATRAFLTPMGEHGWGRIVNVSTELATRAHEQRGGGVYAATKIALNAMTRALSEDLAGSGILVNACSPGWCRTDMGGEGAPRSVEQGADSIVWGATLPDDGPTGGFFQDGEPLPF
jgi:NAD(P)-dependent dehydrogenase (short-subunit alcohol dehydrogenase family)